MYKFSFIIPIYNVNIDMLGQAIESICKQNLKKYEVLLINDGSINSEIDKFCKEICQQNKNIKYFYQENAGSAVARNTGLENATGDYIFFVDADDELTDDFFKCIQKIDGNNDVYVFDYSFWNLEHEKIFNLPISNESDLSDKKNEIMSNILYTPGVFNDFMFGAIWAKCFKKDFLDKNNIRFVPSLRKAQDRMFMLEVVFKCDSIKYCSVYAYKYRTNNESICHKMNMKMIDYYYYYLFNEVNAFCDKNDINKNVGRFFAYNVINEILPLTIFHVEYNETFSVIRKKYFSIINKFMLSSNIKFIKYRDIPSKKGKVKLFLYKHNCVYFLYKFFIRKQVKEYKNSFK